MDGQQQKAVKTFMQRLIRGGVVDPWEWPRLQEKWLQDIRGFNMGFDCLGCSNFFW